MTAYNGLNSIKTNLEAAGICKHDGLRLSDPKCTHATPAQIVRTKKMDADYDFMQTYKDQARLCNSIIQDVQPRLYFVLDLCGDIDDNNGGDVDLIDITRWEDEKPVTKTINLNGYKATATASWRERHLNES